MIKGESRDHATVGMMSQKLREFINSSLAVVESHGAEMKSDVANDFLRITSMNGLGKYIPTTAYSVTQDDDWEQYLDLNPKQSEKSRMTRRMTRTMTRRMRRRRSRRKTTGKWSILIPKPLIW